MLAVDTMCAAGTGIGALVGLLVPRALAGFFVGIHVVAKRFHEI
jgi:hypothetical protein